MEGQKSNGINKRKITARNGRAGYIGALDHLVNRERRQADGKP